MGVLLLYNQLCHNNQDDADVSVREVLRRNLRILVSYVFVSVFVLLYSFRPPLIELIGSGTISVLSSVKIMLRALVIWRLGVGEYNSASWSVATTSECCMIHVTIQNVRPSQSM